MPPTEAPQIPLDKPEGYFELDYDKIQKDLKEGDKALKLKLLQALRWVRSGNQTFASKEFFVFSFRGLLKATTLFAKRRSTVT